jgi:hypothetical protein
VSFQKCGLIGNESIGAVRFIKPYSANLDMRSNIFSALGEGSYFRSSSEISPSAFPSLSGLFLDIALGVDLHPQVKLAKELAILITVLRQSHRRFPSVSLSIPGDHTGCDLAMFPLDKLSPSAP